MHKQVYENIQRKVTDLVDNAETAFYSFKIQTNNLCKELLHNFNTIPVKSSSRLIQQQERKRQQQQQQQQRQQQPNRKTGEKEIARVTVCVSCLTSIRKNLNILYCNADNRSNFPKKMIISADRRRKDMGELYISPVPAPFVNRCPVNK